MSDKVVSIVGSLCSVFGLIAALVFGFRAEGYVFNTWVFVGIAILILGIIILFVGIYYKRKKRKEEEKAELNRHRGIDLRNIPFTPMPTATKQAVTFSIGIEYRNYMNFITYTNKGNREARNVMVNVEQSKTETNSETVIENASILPVDLVAIGDHVDLEVSCYYKKTYRHFTIEWDDETGKHSQENNLLLSKYLYEQP